MGPACLKAVSFQRTNPVPVSLQLQIPLVPLANAVTSTSHSPSLPETSSLRCSTALSSQRHTHSKGHPTERGLARRPLGWEQLTWALRGARRPGLAASRCSQPERPGTGAAGTALAHPTRTTATLALSEVPRPTPGARSLHPHTQPFSLVAPLDSEGSRLCGTVCGTAPASLQGGGGNPANASLSASLTNPTDKGHTYSSPVTCPGLQRVLLYDKPQLPGTASAARRLSSPTPRGSGGPRRGAARPRGRTYHPEGTRGVVGLQGHLLPVVLRPVLVHFGAAVLHLLPRRGRHRLLRLLAGSFVFIVFVVIVMALLGLLLIWEQSRSCD